jgi:hypothetical protein
MRLSLGINASLLNNQPPNATGPMTAAANINAMNGTILISPMYMADAKCPIIALGSKIVSRDNIKLARVISTNFPPIKSEKYNSAIEPNNNTKEVAKSRERGTCPSSRAFSIFRPLASSVFSWLSSSAI